MRQRAFVFRWEEDNAGNGDAEKKDIGEKEKSITLQKLDAKTRAPQQHYVVHSKYFHVTETTMLTDSFELANSRISRMQLLQNRFRQLILNKGDVLKLLSVPGFDSRGNFRAKFAVLKSSVFDAMKEYMASSKSLEKVSKQQDVENGEKAQSGESSDAQSREMQRLALRYGYLDSTRTDQLKKSLTSKPDEKTRQTQKLGTGRVSTLWANRLDDVTKKVMAGRLTTKSAEGSAPDLNNGHIWTGLTGGVPKAPSRRAMKK
jgi:hypothetical protein